MDFKKYQHVERIGTAETEGLLDGLVHVFYKIDGTNGSIWLDDGLLRMGSRNREISIENDNAGMMRDIAGGGLNDALVNLLSDTGWRLYGEWLVPHSLKTYRQDAWRQFYVFDVMVGDEYVEYEEYQPLLEYHGIQYIPPICTIKNPSEEMLFKALEKCGEFLVEDGKGKGEGVVIKNYCYRNRFGRQTWGKITTTEFKEKHNREMGAPVVNDILMVEDRIIDLLTEEFILKEKAKIDAEPDGWTSRQIPRLLGTVWHEFIRDHIWEILKKHKNPKVNFKYLNGLVIRKVKATIGI